MPARILLLLDLASENPLPEDEVVTQMGAGPIPRIFRATEFGVSATARGSAIDWPRASRAIVRMVAAARSAQEASTGAELFVAGRAGLPLFAQLGMELSKWATATVLNKRHDGTWDRFEVGSPGKHASLFAVTLPSSPSEASGRVAIAISCGQRIDDAHIRAFAEMQGAALAGIVHAQGPAVIDPPLSAGMAAELVALLVSVKKSFPHVTGMSMHVAGPAPLAFFAGRAVNPNVFSDVWLPNFEQGRYVPAVALPLATPSPVLLPDSEEVRTKRTRVLARLVSSIGELQAAIDPTMVPAFIDREEAQLLVDHVKTIAVFPEPLGEAFDLSIAERRMAFGRGLLDALVDTEDLTLDRLAKILFLHEVYHSRQSIHSTTYAGIGRAGVALEEVDFWADAVSISIAVEFEARRDAAPEKVLGNAKAYLEAALQGIAAFDRAEHGTRIVDLPERRLRRYLIWSLQLARGVSIKTISDFYALLSSRLIVEIAPIRGGLDGRYDKQVTEVASNAELFIVLDRRLTRVQRHGAIDPAAIVESVRQFDLKGLVGVMSAVRDEHLERLAPWVERTS